MAEKPTQNKLKNMEVGNDSEAKTHSYNAIIHDSKKRIKSSISRGVFFCCETYSTRNDVFFFFEIRCALPLKCL